MNTIFSFFLVTLMVFSFDAHAAKKDIGFSDSAAFIQIALNWGKKSDKDSFRFSVCKSFTDCSAITSCQYTRSKLEKVLVQFNEEFQSEMKTALNGSLVTKIPSCKFFTEFSSLLRQADQKCKDIAPFPGC